MTASRTSALSLKVSPAHWLALLMMAVAGVVLGFMLFKPIRVLPRLLAAPAYTLIDRHGQVVSDADLRGKVVLMDFIYTHCTTVCPAMTGQMLQVQRRLEELGWLGDEVMLVTITFDPERDTPERLAAYAAQVGADPAGWLWLTGDSITVRQLVGSEFGVYFEKVALDEAAAEAAGLSEAERAAGYDFIHATVFVLVDEQGIIRAEYQSMLDVEQAVRDIRLVVREKNAGVLARPLWQAAHLIRAYP